jgi:hypothetical protein
VHELRENAKRDSQMKAISTLITAAGAWGATAGAIMAGEATAPAATSDNGDGAVALFLVLGILVVVGGMMKPKSPPDSAPDDEG